MAVFLHQGDALRTHSHALSVNITVIPQHLDNQRIARRTLTGFYESSFFSFNIFRNQ